MVVETSVLIICNKQQTLVPDVRVPDGIVDVGNQDLAIHHIGGWMLVILRRSAKGGLQEAVLRQSVIGIIRLLAHLVKSLNRMKAAGGPIVFKQQSLREAIMEDAPRDTLILEPVVNCVLGLV